MKIVKDEKIKMMPTEMDKIKEVVEENVGYMTDFFNEAIEKYKKGGVLNFIMIVEDFPGDNEDIEVYGITHSTGRHLQGVMEDAGVVVRRRIWGEEDEE